MSICPFTTFRPTPFGGRTLRRKGQRGILHVAVSERDELPPWNGNTWHFYVNKAGAGFQFVDTDFCAWASVDANGDAISIETEGGVVDPDHELWTPPQAETIARIIRWVHDDEGTPMELLPDSKPGRRGWGPHRLGIDPWRVPGGEKWSSSRAKLCPGAGKIGQIPGILAMAAGNGEDDEMDKDQDNMLRNIYLGMFSGGESTPNGQSLFQRIEAIPNRIWWETTVERFGPDGKTTMHVPVIQEVADAKSQAIAANAALAAVVEALANAKDFDADAVKTSVMAGVSQALKENVVHVNVNVAGGEDQSSPA